MIIRPARRADAPDMTALLNQIIEIGGTTAHQTPFDEDRMHDHYIAAPALIGCQVAEIDNAVRGFQWLRWGDPEKDEVPQGWAIIASFVSVQVAGHGIGRQLFKATLSVAENVGVKAIDATIRADNTSGLRYYSGIGFDDYARLKDIPLTDGTRVDKIRKRLEIG